MSNLIPIGYEYDGRGLKQQRDDVERSTVALDKLDNATQEVTSSSSGLEAELSRLTKTTTQQTTATKGLAGGYGLYSKKVVEASVNTRHFAYETKGSQINVDGLARAMGMGAKQNSAYAASQMAVGRSAGAQKMALANVGYQLQDTAVQAQMGVSAFTILSQQGGQLVAAFNPLIGAGVTLAAVLGGVLYKAMTGVKKESEELDINLKELRETYADMTRLARESRAIDLQKIIEKQEKELKTQQEILDAQEAKTEEAKRAIQNIEEELELNGSNARLEKQRERLLQNIADYNEKISDSSTQVKATQEELNGSLEEARSLKQDLLDEDKLTLNVLKEKYALEDENRRKMLEDRRQATFDQRKLRSDTQKTLEEALSGIALEGELLKAKLSEDAEKVRQLEAALIDMQSTAAAIRILGDGATTEEVEKLSLAIAENIRMQKELNEEKDWTTEIDQMIADQQREVNKETDYFADKWREIKEESLQFYSSIKSMDFEAIGNQLTSPLQATQTLIGGIADVHTAMTAQEVADNERAIKTLNEKQAVLEQELQNTSGLSAAQIEAKKRELENIKAQKEAKERALRDQFEANKKFQLTQIVANTAVEASKVLSNPIALFGVLAAGAAQFATVKAQEFNSPASVASATPSVNQSYSTSSTSITSSPNVNFNVTGNLDQNVAEQLAELIKNGAIPIPADSDQARVLAGR